MPRLLILITLIGACGAALAEGMTTVGEVMIHDAWARASVGPVKTSAAYMTIEIAGDETDRLIAVASPLAANAQLHTHLMQDGIARMRPVEAIEVAPGAPTVLEPGGLHVMLTGLQEPLVQGGTLPLTLTFETAGRVDLAVPIRGLAGRMQSDHGQHGDQEPMTN